MNHRYFKYKNNIINKRIVDCSSKEFNSICKSQKKIKNLKNFINKEKKIVIFRKVINKNILRNIIKNRNSILKRKPLFSKTFLGSKDQFIFNKQNKGSYVKGYYRKIELYPWNEKNEKIFLNLNKVMNLKCWMDNMQFKGLKKKKFFDTKKFIKLHLMQYPPKKGFLTKHIDGIYKTIMVVQFGMSLSLKKTKNGGLIFYFGKEKVSMDHYVKPGDIFVYNSIIPHAVKPSKSRKGRWSTLVSSGYFGGSKGTKLQSQQVN